MFDPPTPMLDAVFQMSLPEARCSAGGHKIARRQHRVTFRASWRAEPETICPGCWQHICEWAKRFALSQMALDLEAAELKQT
jgi:hypothetical protein